MAIKDLVSGVLSESITASTTNILVNVAQNISASEIQSLFPTPPFYITIMPKTPTVGVANRLDSEIIKITAVGSDQSGNAFLTGVRAQRNTTAKAFSAGDIVTVGVYAEDAVLLGGDGSTTSTTAYEKKLVDKDGNTIVPITGYMGKVYTATLSTATAGGVAQYDFTPDTPIENNKVYAVKFPTPIVSQDAAVLAPGVGQKNTIILGDGVVSGSILVPPVAATESPNYELLTTDMINNTEPLLLVYNGVQWVCLNQKKKVDTADLNDDSVTSDKIDWTTLSGDKWPLINTGTSNNNINNKEDYVQYSFAVPASGRYFVSFTQRLGSNAANGYGLTVKVKLDGTTISQSGAAITGNASYMYAVVSCVVSANVGQVITCASTGGSTNSTSTTNGRVSLARIA